MSFERIVAEFKRHEGKVSKGGYHKLYKDTVDKWTIGYGRNLSDRGISEDEALYLLHNDIQDTIEELRAKYYWFDSLDPVRREVVIDMAFNMGVPTFATFVNTIGYIAEGQYQQASRNMLKSKWARQVGKRAQELAREMESGVAET